MTQKKQKKILILALLAGEIMMKAGAEIYRVEDTIVRICKACKVDFVECFTTMTGIFLSLDSADKTKDMHTFIKRIPWTDINLNKISLVNEFSREFTTTSLSVDDGFERLRGINNLTKISLWLRVIGAFIVGAFFAPIYGGGIVDMAVCGVSAAVGYLASEVIDKLNFPDFVRIFMGTFICAALAFLANSFIPLNQNAVIIGAITVFMPGVAITNSARDILSGDMLSGTARAVDAVVTAVSIALGVGIAIKGASLFDINDSPQVLSRFPIQVVIFFGIFATLGFCILFDAPKKFYPVICLNGAVSLGIYLLFVDVYDERPVFACFIGAVVAAVISEICSRAGKEATTIFIIPAIIPFVPGKAMFETMQDLLTSNYDSAFSHAVQTFSIAGAIAIALVFVAALTRILRLAVGAIQRLYRKR